MSTLSVTVQPRVITTKTGEKINFQELVYEGNVEASTIDIFQKGFQDQLDADVKNIIINLDKIDYITSTGLGGLVKYYNLFAEKDGEMIMLCSNDNVLGVIDLLGLQALLTIYKDIPEMEKNYTGGASGKFELSANQQLSALRAEATAGHKVTGSEQRKPGDIPVVMALPDDNLFSALLRDQLVEEGVYVISTNDAKEAFNLIRDNNAAAIIIDYSLEDHETLVARIKSTSKTSTCSVIHIYAEGASPEHVKHLVLLPNEYILEPCSSLSLSALVKSEIQRKRSESTFIKHELQMRFPSATKFIGKANKLMEKVLEEPLGTEKNTYLAMRSSLREAIDNANRHGNKEDDSKYINVIYILDNEKMTLSIKDCGQGFDYNAVINSVKGEKAADLAERRNFDSLGGLGIPLMLRCTDILKYNEKGNEVTQVKYLRKKKKAETEDSKQESTLRA